MKQIDTSSSRVKQQALWFIQLEKERVLHNFHNGTTGKEQTVGSLNTLYQIASHINDMECMKNLWQCIADVRNAKLALQPRLHFTEQTRMV
jgi:hypothetical protein